MNKPALLLAALLLFATCLPLWAQEEDAILVGEERISVLYDEPYSEWYIPTFEAYELDMEVLENCRDAFSDEIELVLLMGTWCSDSREQVPVLMKILEQVDREPDRLIFLDKDKKGDEQQEEEFEISMVPTLIVLYQGEELGRIEEAPQQSWEQDLCEILNRQEE